MKALSFLNLLFCVSAYASPTGGVFLEKVESSVYGWNSYYANTHTEDFKAGGAERLRKLVQERCGDMKVEEVSEIFFHKMTRSPAMYYDVSLGYFKCN